MPRFLATKPLSILTQEAHEVGENTLKRSLGPVNLITLGIGAIIGAGIFVLTGQAAALHAGPLEPPIWSADPFGDTQQPVMAAFDAIVQASGVPPAAPFLNSVNV